MNLHIDPQILARFPGSITGVVVVKNINNVYAAPLTKLAVVADQVRAEFAAFEAPSMHPHIRAWRQAFKQFGCDPQKYRCSAEALVRQVLKGNTIWGINPLVDIYNYISLKYVVPVGGEDLDHIQGAVQLTFASGGEQFIRLGGTENEPPLPGEVIYKDDVGVLCRRWNWREADRTKLTAATTNAILVIDGLAPMTRDQVEQATRELTDRVQQYCGGQVQWEVLS